MSLPKPPIAHPHRDLNELHRALGSALTQWQNIETALYIITHCLIGTSHEISSLMFFQIRSAENKKVLVDRLIFENMTQYMRTKKWEPLSTGIGDIIKFRNFLAHFEIFWIDKSKPGKMPNTKYDLVISSHHLDIYARRSGGAQYVTIEQIAQNDAGMGRAVITLINFLFECVPNSTRGIESLPPNSQHWLDQFRKTEIPQ